MLFWVQVDPDPKTLDAVTFGSWCGLRGFICEGYAMRHVVVEIWESSMHLAGYDEETHARPLRHA